MKHDISDSFRGLALMLGCAGALLCYLLLSLFQVERAGGWSLMVGATLTAACSLFFWIVLNAHHERRYHDIPQTIAEPIILTVNAYVTVDDITRNGYLYLTAETLICHFRDRTPYTKMAFFKADWLKVNPLSSITVHISDPHHTFEIMSTDAELLIEKMKHLGWPVGAMPKEESKE